MKEKTFSGGSKMTIYWGKILVEFSDETLLSTTGFNFVQLPVDAIMNLSTDSFNYHKNQLRKLNLVPLACSSPLPADVQVTEMGFNLYVWTEYLKKAIRRIAELGCRKLIWNNGRARVLPWEGDVAGVKEQVLQFLYMLCDVADEYDITVLVEPLSPLRTNFLNTMDETSDFLGRVGKNNLSSMISFRELDEIGLNVKDIPLFIDLIEHVQLENPSHHTGQRIAPAPSDAIDYRPFLKQLKQSGYSEMICLPEDADRAALDYCHDLWKAL